MHSFKLIAKGAEAYIYYGEFYGLPAIKKWRIPKTYRIKTLDAVIRKTRTKREAKLLRSVKKIGIPAPTVYEVDLRECSIIMEFIRGELLRDALLSQKIPHKKALELFLKIGEFVGMLHENSIVHGDLTTSNIILVNAENDELVFIDFGLGDVTNSIEEFGVELRVFRSSLASTHYDHDEEFFSAFENGYRKTFSKASSALKKYREIMLRGRYVAERRQKSFFSEF
ncbi:MAG: KEOPS complex kinase/ATPase Bud32 [Candidatus Njordarchaeales archaeon]